jgi:23S rRNA (guanine745-N1)-methyltransferase
MDLFRMTPYTWKTPREGVERLDGLERLRVTASFRVHVFRKNG